MFFSVAQKDVLLKLITFLDYRNILRLRQTCKFMYVLLSKVSCMQELSIITTMMCVDLNEYPLYEYHRDPPTHSHCSNYHEWTVGRLKIDLAAPLKGTHGLNPSLYGTPFSYNQNVRTTLEYRLTVQPQRGVKNYWILKPKRPTRDFTMKSNFRPQYYDRFSVLLDELLKKTILVRLILENYAPNYWTYCKVYNCDYAFFEDFVKTISSQYHTTPKYSEWKICHHWTIGPKS